jgi:hypothetical protein
MTRVAPAGPMSAATMSQHMMARHAEPFWPTGIAESIDIPECDLALWKNYHAYLHSHERTDDGHTHRGE